MADHGRGLSGGGVGGDSGGCPSYADGYVRRDIRRLLRGTEAEADHSVTPKPRILMFDALDNITQKEVFRSFDAMKCTSMIIPHRLSTIKQCGRVIYL